jgi:hypothetical protein
MRAGCLLVIWGVIRQLKERKGINHARPKRKTSMGASRQDLRRGSHRSVGGAKHHAPETLDGR